MGSAGANGGFFNQKFITGGNLELDQAVAEREVVATQFELEAQEQRVLNDVRVRFYEAMIAQRRVKLTDDLATIGENLVKAARTLLDNRQGTENDLLQAEIRSENARILYENAQNESREAWRRLAAVLGAPHLPESELAGDIQENFPDYDWDSALETLLACHPDVQAALARVERTGFAIQRARREPIPNFDLFVSVRHQDFTKDEIANIQAGIPVPIFDRNQGNIRSAEAEWIAARNDVNRIELELQDRLAVTFRRYANARQQVQRYGQTIVPRAERSLKLVTEGYEKGQVEYLTLLTAQQTYLEVTLANLDSLRELRVSEALIEGQLLTDSLSARK
jgi:cobalt-zinc-cadmium efflux system outer membrane protein